LLHNELTKKFRIEIALEAGVDNLVQFTTRIGNSLRTFSERACLFTENCEMLVALDYLFIYKRN
jgi:hypothetical protein